MNISCPQCAKHYVLPDGTVLPGVEVRLRCKQCQHVFTVTEQMAAASKAQADDAAADHLAQVPIAAQAPSDPNAPPGELTRHFISQSGADKRNPPWKIALFVAAGVGLPVAVLYVLSSFHLATVTVTNDDGEEVEQPFFSSEGVAGLKDLLSGKQAERQKAKQAAAAKRRALEAQAGAHGSGGLDSNERKGASVGHAQTAEIPSGSLGAFYAGDDHRAQIAPKVKGAGGEQVPKEHLGGLDEADAAKVVGQSQPAFLSCIETALRRNPNLKVGKIVMTVTVGSSGVVKRSQITPKQHDGSDWGTCLKERARRMVFPKSPGDDETELEVPLLVGVSL